MKRSVLRRKEYDKYCWKSEQDKVGIFLAVQWVGLEDIHTVSHTLMQWAFLLSHHTGKNVHNTESFLLGQFLTLVTAEKAPPRIVTQEMGDTMGKKGMRESLEKNAQGREKLPKKEI